MNMPTGCVKALGLGYLPSAIDAGEQCAGLPIASASELKLPSIGFCPLDGLLLNSPNGHP